MFLSSFLSQFWLFFGKGALIWSFLFSNLFCQKVYLILLCESFIKILFKIHALFMVKFSEYFSKQTTFHENVYQNTFHGKMLFRKPFKMLFILIKKYLEKKILFIKNVFQNAFQNTSQGKKVFQKYFYREISNLADLAQTRTPWPFLLWWLRSYTDFLHNTFTWTS